MHKILLLVSLSAISAEVLSVAKLSNINSASPVDIKQESSHQSIGTAAVDILSKYKNNHLTNPLKNKVSFEKNEKVYLKLNQVGAWFWTTKNSHFKVGGMITTHQWWEYDDARLRDNNNEGRLPLTGINAAYQNGRFSAETGILNHESNGAKFFIKGAYIVAKTPNFSLELTAKIEALDDNLVEHYYGVDSYGVDHIGQKNVGIGNSHLNSQYPSSPFQGESSENTSVGLTGSYSFSNNWTVTGSVTTTTLGEEIIASPLIKGVSRNMALIGTTYSF
jgi:outer membrane scaffolding protein for murein synthesis (MipA/OmpV family)